jgi:hypothetical protein
MVRAMKLLIAAIIIAVSVCMSCNLVPNARTVDYAGARKVSDSFMADLVTNKIEDAISLMESEFVQPLGRTQAEAQVRKLFDYCGRPLDSEFKHDETGFKVYLDGHKNPMRKFYYAATTDQYPKGTCFFSVSVVPDHAEFRVTEFGPLKLLSGELPAWLK